MIKTVRNIIASMSLLLLSVVPAVAVVSTASAGAVSCDGIQNCVDGGISSTDSSGTTGTVDAETKVTQLAQDVINIFSWVVGIISVIMVIVGGFQYITSGGDSGKVTTAKNTIMYALIGIVIVALSQIMVKFVLQKFVN